MSVATPSATPPPRRRRRSPAGHTASSANALTHGLTASVLFGRDRAMVEDIAEAFLAGARRTPAAWESACRAGEAHVDVLRVDAECFRLMRAMEDDPQTYAVEMKSDARVELGFLKRGLKRRPVAGPILQDVMHRRHQGPPRNATRRQLILYGTLAPKLQTLRRYAAAARGRRRQAIADLDRILGGVTLAS